MRNSVEEFSMGDADESVNIYRHGAVESIVRELIGNDDFDADPAWNIQYYYHGRHKSCPLSEYLKMIGARTHWGFARSKGSQIPSIHIWFTENCTFSDLLSMLAHEYAHIEYPDHCKAPDAPYINDPEKRSNSYADVAIKAWKTAKELWKGASR